MLIFDNIILKLAVPSSGSRVYSSKRKFLVANPKRSGDLNYSIAHLNTIIHQLIKSCNVLAKQVGNELLSMQLRCQHVQESPLKLHKLVFSSIPSQDFCHSSHEIV